MYRHNECILRNSVSQRKLYNVLFTKCHKGEQKRVKTNFSHKIWRHRWENNIEKYHEERECEGEVWKPPWRNDNEPSDFIKGDNLLTSCEAVSFSQGCCSTDLVPGFWSPKDMTNLVHQSAATIYLVERSVSQTWTTAIQVSSPARRVQAGQEASCFWRGTSKPRPCWAGSTTSCWCWSSRTAQWRSWKHQQRSMKWTLNSMQLTGSTSLLDGYISPSHSWSSSFWGYPRKLQLHSLLHNFMFF